MKVSCPSCDAKYTIADDKVLGKKIKVRCKTCSTQILVDGTAPHGVDASGVSDSTADGASGIPEDSLAPPASPSMQPAESDAWTVNLSETEERTMTTSELVEAAVKNELGPDVYVWKDGMGDWILYSDVPELKNAIDAAKKKAGPAAHKTPAASKVAPKLGASKASSAAKAGGSKTASAAPAPIDPGESRGPIVAAPGSALAKKMASAKAASQAHKAEAAAAPKDAPEEKPLPDKKAAMRPGTKRPQSTHDLFAAVDQAGSEIDVDTSAATEDVDHSKATGARNENSVLFSLDALKSGVTAAKGAPAPAAAGKRAPAPPAKRLEDLMTIDAPSPMGPGGGGVGAGLLLSGNDALLTAPAPPPPKPEPKPAPVVSAAAGIEVPLAKPKNKWIMLGAIIAAVGIVGTAGAVIALKVATPDTPETPSASATPSGAPSASSVRIAASSAPTPSASAVAAASAEPEPSASATTAAAAAPVHATGGDHKATATKPSDTKDTKKPDTKSEPSPAIAAGGFSKDAAVAALSVAAAQATVCKKPEGPWGSGKCLVTFAPSGRVTTANVTGAPFAGTPVGGCVSSVFRRAKVPAFSGEPVTVSKSFTISP